MSTTTAKYIMIFSIFLSCCCAALFWKWTREIEKVLVPAHVSLDTAKYKILKEDSLTLDGSTMLTDQGMKIKRVYYLKIK